MSRIHRQVSRSLGAPIREVKQLGFQEVERLPELPSESTIALMRMVALSFKARPRRRGKSYPQVLTLV